jgi:hypothetical protein
MGVTLAHQSECSSAAAYSTMSTHLKDAAGLRQQQPKDHQELERLTVADQS